MAFLSSNNPHDSQWPPKRSTSPTRERRSPSGPSTNDRPLEEPLRKRSPSLSASPSSLLSSESPESAPPLPIPVTAGQGSRPRTARTREAPPSSYDQSSTPIPFTRPRVSPPPFSSLIIDVQSRNLVDTEQSQSPRLTLKGRRSTSRSRAAPPSPSASYSIPSPASSTPAPPEGTSMGIHPVSPPHAQTPGLISPSTTHGERQQRGFSQRLATVLPLKLPHSPTRKRSSEAAPVALPTPVSPPQGQRAARPEPIPILPASPLGHIHARSRSATNSPTTYSPGSTKSSARRIPTSTVDPHLAGAPSGPRSASASSNSTPTHEPVAGKPQEKRPRNVLRKRSLTSGTRRREPDSAPASDSEKKVGTQRPRSRSVVFSSRRNSSGPILDVLHPLPVKPETAVDLTPAKEILVAYKESHRNSFSRDTPLHGSGKLVAVGSEDSVAGPSRSPWTAGLKRGRKGETSADERDVHEKVGGETAMGTLRRKLSGKRSGKEPSTRHDEPTRSVSGSAVEGSERKLTLHIEGKRSATFSNDTWVGGSHGHGHSPGRGLQPGHEEGRVWEEDVGDWVGKHLRDTETGKDVSNSRRLWRLVKRLSSGNLREKASSPVEAPPPVPPLPKDLASRQPGMSPGDYDASEMPIPQSAVPETPGGIRRYISAVPSVSIPHAGPGLPPAQLRMTATHRTVTTTITTPQMRRSTTTRSSSPSSETTKFFSRSRSSSSSSYGDAMVPPIPSMPCARAGKGAASPREHSSGHNEKGQDNVTVERSPSVKASRPSSANTSEETSYGIPSFEAYNAVNKFLPYGGRRPSVSLSPISHFPDHEPIAPRSEHAKHTHPPPIPKRNPHRPGHPSVSIPSLPLPVHQHSMPNVIPVQDASESETLDGDALRAERRRDTEQTPTIPKARPRSISDGAIIPEHPHTAKSTSVTFREMTRTQRQLTEQEKTAKWEDLLQRSDKAGGTLHVGSPTTGGGLGLWSDRSSVALSETLDSTDQE